MHDGRTSFQLYIFFWTSHQQLRFIDVGSVRSYRKEIKLQLQFRAQKNRVINHTRGICDIDIKRRIIDCTR